MKINIVKKDTNELDLVHTFTDVLLLEMKIRAKFSIAERILRVLVSKGEYSYGSVCLFDGNLRIEWELNGRHVRLIVPFQSDAYIYTEDTATNYFDVNTEVNLHTLEQALLWMKNNI